MNEFSPEVKTLVSIIPESFRGSVSDQLLVSDVQTDSREVSPGSLFIAVPGITGDGEDYITNAIENGAVAVLVEDGHQSTIPNVEVPVIAVKNLKANLSKIAAAFYTSSNNNALLYGVTGTNGKSTITSLIAQLHKSLNEPAGVVGTLGFGFIGDVLTATGMTTPDNVKSHRIIAALKDEGARCIAMEVSSHGIDQGRIDNITFDVGVISNITHDHLDYHGSFEAYADVKRGFLLSENCRVGVVNLDDDECVILVDAMRRKHKQVVTYGIHNDQADVKASINCIRESGFDVLIESPWGSAVSFIPLIGNFNLSNLLAALSALCAAGKDFNTLLKKVGRLVPVEGRLQEITASEIPSEKSNSPRVFVDFAHTPDALARVLEALRAHVNGRLFVVFGCGGDRDKAKRPKMAEVAVRLADRVVITSDNPRTENPSAIIDDILSGIARDKIKNDIQIAIEVEREKAIHTAIAEAKKQDTVLIAGKGHEEYQIIGEEKRPFSDALVAKSALKKNRAASQQVSR